MYSNRLVPALLSAVLLAALIIPTLPAESAAPGAIGPVQPAAANDRAPARAAARGEIAPVQPAAGVEIAPVQPAAPAPPPVQPATAAEFEAALQPGMIRWAGTPIRGLDVFRGKTVVVLVYATWCPKCNAWSGELFQQLKQASATRPVVILAINTDESPQGVQEYLAQRGFFAPNIFHGHDPLLPKRLGLESNLFQAAIISHDGRLTGMQYAGVFTPTPAGNRFALARLIGESSELGEFRFISPDMSPQDAALLWPLELGPFSELALRRVRTQLGEEDKAKLDAAIEKFLDARLAEIRQLYYGELADKLQAYDLSMELAKMFRDREQCATARRVVAALEAQPGFERELLAKRSYEKMAQTARQQPAQRASLLFRVARAYEGTHYGELARKEAAAAKDPPPGNLP